MKEYLVDIIHYSKWLQTDPIVQGFNIYGKGTSPQLATNNNHAGHVQE